MFKNLETYEASKPYLIAIDSDGCVFDNMTVKHQQFFFPNILEVFQMTDEDGQMKLLWDRINLEYPTRGINRFKGLGMFFEHYEPRGDVKAYKQWLKDSSRLSNDALEAFNKDLGDEFITKVLKWSSSVNQTIESELGHVHPFDYAKEAIRLCAEVADVVVVSSANPDAVQREWAAEDLLQYVQFLGSQNTGSKAEILRQLIGKGYESSKVLMIGDANGDYQAAQMNHVHYFQIPYQAEVQGWQQFNQVSLHAFIEGTYQYMGNEVLNKALEDAFEVLKVNIDRYTDHFQHVSEEGVYPLEENKLWTMSFYPGQLYLAYKETGDASWIRNRDTILASFRERCDHGHMATHDIGFLFELTAYYDYLATGDEASKQMVLDAADRLMLRYHEVGGFIQAWGPLDENEDETRIIIDCMMNLPLLYITSDLTGDPKYAQAAQSHALVSSETLLRADGSTYHTYWMNQKTGNPVRGATHQGHQDTSTWARGQAWSVYGFYKSYQWTQDQRFLEAAIRSAEVFINNLPVNDICYWDFDFTDENPDIRDSSAASIAAAGLIEISKVVDEPLRSKYRNKGIELLTILANRYQNSQPTLGCGILKEGMYHRNNGARSYVSWGDYYYVEALLLVKNRQ